MVMVKRWELLAILQLTLVAADIQVYNDGEPFILVADFLLAEANFGDKIPLGGIHAMATLADPPNACAPIRPPPTDIPNPPERWAVLIKRYNCTFEQKVINAQNAFYDIAIVHNVDSNKLEIMNVSDPDKISIISVFITANAGREIGNKYLYDKGYYLLLERSGSSDFLSKILLPFVGIVTVCFILISGFMVAKCIKDYRRARRRRMPYASLNKIPIAKYRKSDPFETCAICFDDFVEGEKLRILPCSHAYHTKCIDPWLTRRQRVCPLCKRRVFAADETVESDLESSDDDNQPLLRGQANQRPTYGGTNNAQVVSSVRVLSSSLPPDVTLQTLLQQHRARVIARIEGAQDNPGSGSDSDGDDNRSTLSLRTQLERMNRLFDDLSSIANTHPGSSSSDEEEYGTHHEPAVVPESAVVPVSADSAHQENTEDVVVEQPSSERCVIS